MYKTIVVALDCGETSERVIGALNTLKIEDQTKIIFSHVLRDPNPELDPDRPTQSRETLYQRVEEQLEGYQTDFPNSQIEIASGDPAEEIIRLGNIYQADLIILGTRGLTGFKRVIEGSVSGQVVAEASCSVFVVKVSES
ncbi:UspA domain protein [Gloeothece citriformis PCC 7424]|uniref:UspA domain protein n=1 Tax=Gloeothece citriformis (strain PCC 7424) TaxID=65393 RepID=B7KJ93_GLOC7|nr:universal stress protein [Gloeothece citriformis]ACK72177.1 UspA domain protein [Gloeothece citriformis PCC 7424]